MVLFAVTGILAPFMTLDPPSIVFWRTLIAAAVMAAWLSLRSRALIALAPRDIAKIIGVGLIVGVHWTCFFASIALSNVSVALAGFSTTSFFTAFTEPLFIRRRIRLSEILLGFCVIIGIGLIAGTGREHLTGLAVGILCAVLAALFPVLNHRLVNRGLSSRSLLMYEMAGATIASAALIAIVPAWHFKVPAATDWPPLLTLALLCTVFAHTLHIHLLRRLTPFTTNLAINFEPFYGILMAAAVFREYEQLHPGFYFGSLAIVAANILQPFLESRRRTRALIAGP